MNMKTYLKINFFPNKIELFWKTLFTIFFLVYYSNFLINWLLPMSMISNKSFYSRLGDFAQYFCHMWFFLATYFPYLSVSYLKCYLTLSLLPAKKYLCIYIYEKTSGMPTVTTRIKLYIYLSAKITLQCTRAWLLNIYDQPTT